MHQCGRQERPECDDVIDLDLRCKAEAQNMRTGAAIGRDALLATGKALQHPQRGKYQLAYSKRDQREDDSTTSRRDRTKEHAEHEACNGANGGHQWNRNRQTGIDRTQQMDSGVTAQSEIRGMTKREKS